MRHFLYLSLIERLKQLTDPAGEPVIKTFDLWNEQVEFVEQEEVFDTPAVFIEFLPVKWTNLGGGVQRAEATIRLHIVLHGMEVPEKATRYNGKALNASICWTASTTIFSISWVAMAAQNSTCSAAQPAAPTITMRNWWKI